MVGQRKRPATQEPEPPRRSKRHSTVTAAPIAPKNPPTPRRHAKQTNAAPKKPVSPPPKVDKIIASKPPLPIVPARPPAVIAAPSTPHYISKVNDWLAANNPANATLATMKSTEPAVSAAPRRGWKTSEFKGCIRLEYNIRVAYGMFKYPQQRLEEFRDREILKLEDSDALLNVYGLKGWTGVSTIRNVNALMALFENIRDKRTDSTGIDALCQRKGIARAIYDEWREYRDHSVELAARRANGEKDEFSEEVEEEEEEEEDPYDDEEDEDEVSEEEQIPAHQLWDLFRVMAALIAVVAAHQRRRNDDHEREIQRLRESLCSHKCWNHN
ncbi:hypothetical protein BJ741DRAFT_622792 [Chytriomyces cf. hyalinus JEL632]|nr:hypothetical protein BJ741DRAFT_622792 [Chytriomyces cf. hyalinus JEL632]